MLHFHSQENSLKIQLKFKQFTPRCFHSTTLFHSSLANITPHKTCQNHSYTCHWLSFAVPYHCPAYCYKPPLWCRIITPSVLHHFFYVLWPYRHFHTWTSLLSHAFYMSLKTMPHLPWHTTQFRCLGLGYYLFDFDYLIQFSCIKHISVYPITSSRTQSDWHSHLQADIHCQPPSFTFSLQQHLLAVTTNLFITSSLTTVHS